MKEQEASIFFEPVHDGEMPSLEKKIESEINRGYDAVRKWSGEQKQAYFNQVKDMIARLEQEELAAGGDRASRIRFMAPSLLGVLYDVLGEPQKTIDAVCKAEQFIRDDLDRTKWHVNMAHPHRVLGEYEKAVEHLEAADRLRPEADWVLVNLGVAQALAGKRDLADATFTRLEKVSDLESPESVAAAHARFEDAFRNCADLPAVKRILSKISG